MTTPVRPLYLPPIYQDRPDSGRLILRDGTTANIHIAHPEDIPELRHFFHSLSFESRLQRFFSPSPPRDEFIASMADPSDPKQQLTLVVERMVDGQPRIVAAASYTAIDDHTAEVAFAVDDAFQGKGLGSLLLERLAVIGVREGITRFWAVTHSDNRPMIETFRQSGFQIKTRWDGSDIEIDLSVAPSANSTARSEMRDRVSTIASLRPIFEAQSVAVIGASRDPSAVGYLVVDSLIRGHYQGVIYPVNPHAAAIHSIRTYPSVADLPEAPDLALIAVPRDSVMRAIMECAARGVRAVVVVAQGFADAGPDGKRLQDELVSVVREAGMRLVGPNSLGLIATQPDISLHASFSPVEATRGHVALACQSGSVGVGMLSLAIQRGLGIDHFISLGNKADVSSNDLIQYWEEDSEVNTILLYLESFGNPQRFARLARRVSHAKPIVAVKSGRTFGTTDRAVEALFHQTGVLRANTLEEMFDLAAALTTQPLPAGRRVGILTNATGAGLLASDACKTARLSVPLLSERAQAHLMGILPPTTGVENPLDLPVPAPPDVYRRAASALLASDEVDAVVVVYVGVGQTDDVAVQAALAAALADTREQGIHKPILLGRMAGDDPTAPGPEGIPVYTSPETPAQVLAKIAAYSEWRRRPPAVVLDFDDDRPNEARLVCETALVTRGPGWLTLDETHAVLTAMGIPHGPGGVARSGAEAVALAANVGYPVAMRWVAAPPPETAQGEGMRINVPTPTAVRRTYREMRLHFANRDHGDKSVLIMPMARQGIETRVGVVQDPAFGPMVTFSLAGRYAETIHDVCLRVAPLTDQDAADMVRAIRGYPILDEGLDGHGVDLVALEYVLLRVSRLVEAVPEIAELDLAPVDALPPGQGVWVADARIRVA